MFAARARLCAGLASATAGLACAAVALPSARCEQSQPHGRSRAAPEATSFPRLPQTQHLGRNSPHFAVFTGSGEPTDVSAVLAAAEHVEVVMVGETHDDPVAHQLELLLLISLHKARGCLLSLEMFEWDVQHVLDEYLAGLIREKDFLMDSRPWANYEHDYRPMLEFAKFAKLPVLAANAPRRYVGAVGRGGPKALEGALWPTVSLASYLPPLPLPQPSARYMSHLLSSPAVVRVDQLQIQESEESDAGAPRAASKPHSVQAAGGGGCPYIGLSRRDQLVNPILLWDASMAAAIAKQLAEHPGRVVFHVCGSFHCEGHHGISEMLDHYRPGTRKLVVVIYPEADCHNFEPRHKGAADFVVLTDAALPRSHDYFASSESSEEQKAPAKQPASAPRQAVSSATSVADSAGCPAVSAAAAECPAATAAPA